MNHYNERLHVERVYVARLVHIISISCVHGAIADSLSERALVVINQTMYDTDDTDVNAKLKHYRKLIGVKKENKIRTRVALLEKYTVERFKTEHKVSGEKALLTVYYFIENLCNQGYLSLYEGGLFSSIIEELLVLLDEQNEQNIITIENFEAIDLKRKRKAFYEAGVWLAIAQYHGYFHNAEWVLTLE